VSCTTKKILFIIYSVSFVVVHHVIYGHGFASGTLVQLNNGSYQTIHTICSHALHNTVLVLSYDANISCNTNQHVKIGRRSKSNCYIRLGFDIGFNGVSHDDIVCTPMQEFYVPKIDQWVPAYMLKRGDALLTKNMNAKPIAYIQFVPEPLRIYTLEIENSHTFFVGKYSVLTHNMFLPIAASLGFTVPFGSVATGTAGSFFGPVGMIGGIVLGGVVSIVIKTFYENRILSYKTPTYNIASIKTHCHNSARYNEGTTLTKKPAGCFAPDDEYNKTHTHITPIENPLPKTAIGCIGIEVIPSQKVIPKGYDKYNEPETNKVNGCFEPVDVGDGLLCYSQEKPTVKDNSNIRYNGPKARNWKEFERDCPMGQQHGDKFINTGRQNPKDGSPIRQLSEDIPKTEMFKKGYQFALDRFHEGDHMEVWDKNRNWVGVANLDGSKNQVKSDAEINPINRRLPK
jgi:hypothetical protein